MAKEKKQKSKGAKIALAIGIPVGIIGLLVGTFCILFVDGNRSSYQPTENYSSTEVLNYAVVNGFSTTKSEKKVKVSVEEDELNQILYNTKDSLPDVAKQYVDSIYAEFTDDGVNFCIGAQAWIFKTRAVLATKMSEGKVDEKDSYIFDIQKLSIGKIDVYDLLMKTGIISNSTIQNLFSSSGFSFKADLANKRIYYPKDAMKSDISKLLGSGDPIMTNLIGHMCDNDLLKVICGKNGLGSEIDLAKLETNPLLIDDEDDKTLSIQSDVLKEKLVTLLNSSIIASNKASDMFGYLLYGYSKLSDEQKAFIDPLDLTSIGISVNAGYKGYDFSIKTEDKIETKVTEQIVTNVPECVISPGVEKKIITLTENEINKYLADTSLVGTSYVITGKDYNGVYSASYINIDNFYCNIVKDHIYYTIGINMNGLETRLIVDTQLRTDTTEDFKLVFEVKDIYYGQTIASEGLKAKLLDMMGSAISSIGKWCSFSTISNTLEIDVSQIIYSDPTYGSLLRDFGDSRTSLTDCKIEDLGAIEMFYKATV